MVHEAVHRPAKPFGAEWLIILSSVQHACVAATAYKSFVGPGCHLSDVPYFREQSGGMMSHKFSHRVRLCWAESGYGEVLN